MEDNKINIPSLIGFILSFSQPIIGLVLCIIGYTQIKKTNQLGKELAIGGMVISISLCILFVLLFIIYFIMWLCVLLSGLS